jgi:hypothetical protein
MWRAEFASGGITVLRCGDALTLAVAAQPTIGSTKCPPGEKSSVVDGAWVGMGVVGRYEPATHMASLVNAAGHF